MFGIFNFNKPPGWSSRAVVNRVQRLVRPVKVGHAGTLDPLATGVLLVCVGPATRLVQFAHRLPKVYRASFLLGRQSPTDDVEGEIELHDELPIPTREAIEQALHQFLGSIQQVPPAFSAVKVKGKRAYALARRGKEVQLEARPVQIHHLEILQYDYPQLIVHITCGSGTYVRSLGRDLAVSLGTCAVMSALERTQIGPFHVDQASSPDALDATCLEEALQSPAKILDALPKLTVSAADLEELRHGRTIQSSRALQIDRCRWTDANGPEIAAMDEFDRLAAVVVPLEAGVFRSTCNFPQPA